MLTLTGEIKDDDYEALHTDIQAYQNELVEVNSTDQASLTSNCLHNCFPELPYLQVLDFSHCRVVVPAESPDVNLDMAFQNNPELKQFLFSHMPMDKPVYCAALFAGCDNLQKVDMGTATLSDASGASSFMFATGDVEENPGSIQTITQITIDSRFILTPGDPATLQGSFFDYKEPGVWYAYQNGKRQAALVGFNEFKAYQETHPGVSTYYYGEDPGPEPEPTPETVGWVWEETGWRYYTEDGSYLTGGWEWVADDVYGAHWYYFFEDGFCAMRDWIWDGAWYYIQGNCTMACGRWNWIDNAWYGFNWNGTMCVGWIWDNVYVGWYYCYSNGVMARNTWTDAYWVDDSGRWIS